MSNDFEREAFEERNPAPEDAVYNGRRDGYYWSNYPNVNHPFNNDWMTWQEAVAWQARAQSDAEPVTDQWLIQMRGKYLQTRGVWERPDHRGYTNDINEAGRYSEAKAKEAERMMPNKCKAVRLPVAHGGDVEPVVVVNKASTGEYEFYPGPALTSMPNGMHKAYLRSPAPTQGVPEAITTDDDVERVAQMAGWDNRKYMTPEDYAVWCERMREFVRLSSPPQPQPEWVTPKSPDDFPEVGEYLCKLKWPSGKTVHQVLVRVDADDHSWECDGSELVLDIDVVAWMPILADLTRPIPPAGAQP